MIEECYTYTIMPDFGNAAYAWVRGPGEIRCGVGGNMADYTGWYGDHLISKLLESDLAEWALEFEKNVNQDPCDVISRQMCEVLYQNQQQYFENMWSGIGECEMYQKEKCKQCPSGLIKIKI